MNCTLYNACRFVPMFSSIAHKIVLRSCFVRVLDCAQILGVCAQNCARRRLGRSRSKLFPIFCHLRTKLCPNFGRRSRARLRPISFAPCPFPNLAGTPIARNNNYHRYISETIYAALGRMSAVSVHDTCSRNFSRFKSMARVKSESESSRKSFKLANLNDLRLESDSSRVNKSACYWRVLHTFLATGYYDRITNNII